jgi:hypothetical protein
VDFIYSMGYLRVLLGAFWGRWIGSGGASSPFVVTLLGPHMQSDRVYADCSESLHWNRVFLGLSNTHSQLNQYRVVNIWQRCKEALNQCKGGHLLVDHFQHRW